MALNCVKICPRDVKEEGVQMGLKRELLTELGIEDKAVVDKIMKAHGLESLAYSDMIKSRIPTTI